MSDHPTSTPDSTPSTAAPSSSATDTTGAPAPAAPADSSSPPPSSGTDATPSPSSGDSRQSDREGLLAAVRTVVEKTPKPASEGDTPEGDAARDTATGDKAAAPGTPGTDDKAPSTDAASTDDKTDDKADDLNAPDPTEGELRKLRPETRRRFERLLAQRNEARTALASAQPELDQHRQLQGYLTQHQLAPEDVNVLLGVGAALRRQDYQAFLDGVTPYVMAAQEALGLRVARDLQQQVNDGLLSDEAARELTRARHRAAQAEQRLQDATRSHAQDTNTRVVSGIKSAVDQWEANIRTRDPDFAHKADTVRRFSQALLQERGTPQTAEQAVALVQTAYDEANKMMQRMRPAPQATRPGPSSVHVATGGAPSPNNRQPNSLREAVLLGIERSRRAS